jgi:hypothetical protein
MGPLWLLRMARWARHPPSARRVVTVIVAMVLCAGIVLIEHFWGWPSWATLAPRPHGLRPHFP